ncbi:MAG: hypothetical protein WCI73_17210, partial [Phycisphaerae bacterium]
MAYRCGILIPVGPSPQEPARVADFLDALAVHEPAVTAVLLVDDGVAPGLLAQAVPDAMKSRTTIIPNPRGQAGQGFYGGMCVAIMNGLAWFQRHCPVDFVVKLDTDALVINPFSDQIGRYFEEHPTVGQVGSYTRTANGLDRSRAAPDGGWGIWHRLIQKYRTPIRLWRRPSLAHHYFESALWGRPAVFRGHLEQAFRNGYRHGEHCLGGAYALAWRTIAALGEQHIFDDPLLWLHLHLCEDVTMGVYIRYLGLQSADLVGDGEPFGISFYYGLAYPIEELLARRYSIIHSIKNSADFTEDQIRA